MKKYNLENKISHKLFLGCLCALFLSIFLFILSKYVISIRLKNVPQIPRLKGEFNKRKKCDDIIHINREPKFYDDEPKMIGGRILNSRVVINPNLYFLLGEAAHLFLLREQKKALLQRKVVYLPQNLRFCLRSNIGNTMGLNICSMMDHNLRNMIDRNFIKQNVGFLCSKYTANENERSTRINNNKREKMQSFSFF